MPSPCPGCPLTNALPMQPTDSLEEWPLQKLEEIAQKTQDADVAEVIAELLRLIRGRHAIMATEDVTTLEKVLDVHSCGRMSAQHCWCCASSLAPALGPTNSRMLAYSTPAS